jgi:small subunit ribosomal protein S16
VAVKIKLKRLGKIRAPYYRIVVADARTKRDGRAIEEIGKYHPKAEPSFIDVDSERAQHWLSVGAQPTDPVRKIFEITGDWQKFKGLPGTEGTLKTAAPREDRKEIFAAAVKETLGDAVAPARGRGSGRSSTSSPAAREKEQDSGQQADKAGGAAAKDAGAKDAEAVEAKDAEAKDKATQARGKDAGAGDSSQARQSSRAKDGPQARDGAQAKADRPARTRGGARPGGGTRDTGAGAAKGGAEDSGAGKAEAEPTASAADPEPSGGE